MRLSAAAVRSRIRRRMAGSQRQCETDTFPPPPPNKNASLAEAFLFSLRTFVACTTGRGDASRQQFQSISKNSSLAMTACYLWLTQQYESTCTQNNSFV